MKTLCTLPLVILLGAGCRGDTGRVGWLSAAAVSSESPADSAVHSRRILVDSGAIDFSHGSVSNDGRLLSGIDGRTGNLAIRDLRSGDHRVLTTGGSWTKGDNVLVSLISPDRKSVAFLWSFGAPSYAFELRVIGMDGSGQRVLKRGPRYASHVPWDWTPDSRQLAVSMTAEDGGRQIALLSVSDGSMRVLKSLKWRYASGLKVSPDGRRLAYAMQLDPDSNDRDVFVLDLNGAREMRVTSGGGMKTVLGWSDDGRSVYYSTSETGAATVWRISVADRAAAGPAEVVKADVWAMAPIGLAGSTLFYTVTTRTAAVYTLAADFESGRVLETPSPVASGEDIAQAGRVAWSPDGQRLAFVRNIRGPGAGRTALVLRDIGSGEEHQVPLSLAGTQVLEWSGDGRFVIVAAYDRGTQGRYRIDLASGTAEFLDSLVGYDEVPQRSPDGRREFVVVTDSAADSAFVMARAVGDVQGNIIFRERRIWRAVLSPDGNHIGILGVPGANEQSSYVAILPTAGGEPRVMQRVSEPAFIGVQVSWTPDSRFLVFVHHDVESRKSEFWKAAPGAAAAERWLTLPEAPAYARISPDGRRMAFTGLVGSNLRELWVMENLPSSNGSNR